MKNYYDILSHFLIEGTVEEIVPLGNGLINDTLHVRTIEEDCPDYVLQRINHSIFKDVALLQHNIEVTTSHIRQKLLQAGEDDVDRKVLTFVRTSSGQTYYYDDTSYWRLSVYIAGSVTYEQVDPQYSYLAGKGFGQFQQMLADLDQPLGETIPDFHNIELRLHQFQEAINQNTAGRLEEVRPLVDKLLSRAQEMSLSERLYRDGTLPKRICHCDTKVSNMLFDAHDGSFLCVIDLDTVMPSFIFSDYGDFLRTAANTVAEDDPDLSKIHFRKDIFEAFTRGYLESAQDFLTPVEIEHLPYAVALFPYMQCVRFLTDYLNGDVYYKTQYATHNKVRAYNQFTYFKQVEGLQEELADTVRNIISHN